MFFSLRLPLYLPINHGISPAARDLEGFKSLKCLKPGKRMPQRRVLRVWRLANGRLERPNNRGLCAGKGQAATLEQQRLTARGLVEASARDLEGFKTFKCLKPGKRMPQRRVLRVWRLANGRLERPNNRGLCAGKGQAATLEQQRLTARGLVEAAARDLEGFKTFKCLKPGKRMPQRMVLRVWRLANGRLERPNNRGLCAGKGQAATLEQQRLTARGLGGTFKCLKPGKRMPQRRVLRVWRLANGRLERPNNRGLCAGKGQAATLEQQRLTARGLGGSGARELEGFKTFKCLKPGKRMPQRRVVRVWRLANGRLERPGYVQAKGRLQPWNSKGWRPEGLVEAAARDLEGFKTFKCLKPGKRMPQRRVLRVWRLANGRLERPNNRGLCAGKGQAATLEQQRLTARGLGGSCREGSGGF